MGSEKVTLEKRWGFIYTYISPLSEMSTTEYLTTDEFADRIRYDARTYGSD